MSKQVVTTVLSAEQVAQILAAHTLAARNIDVIPGTQIQAEMMAMCAKDDSGGVGITQYRIEVTTDVVRESWRG